ncbi:PREDICTED: LOW QUALITY PROTEIN: uncharacterized protein LOC104616342 [Phaethon lepturus]|uniref:LOW QUALITY PROTEIN: uncharacterized protein LOC104616342 n=1 Tax=Phaethon lepturus TaxID=97097 RepID=UPI0005308A06|nr:PREDICTED: LOW QUALITY PROTEIN: uncharacterized protein LOC104616342 [Phaethon lepturus]
MDWAQGNWYHLQSVVDRTSTLQEDARASSSQKNVRVRSGRGKSIICAVLSASSAAAVEARERCRNLVRSLQGQVADLKVQLERERDKVKHLQTALKEQLLAGTAHEEIPPRSGTGYPFDDLQAARERVEKLEPPSLRPLVKTEYIYDDDQDQSPQVTTKEVPYTATELAKLKKDFSRTPGESEMEYVWRVSFLGGDQILLSEKEAEGYWGPGVFLITGNHCAPWSLTQWVAYWARGLNALERGDPLEIMGTVDQLVESVQKAACLQMMYDPKLEPRQKSSMTITGENTSNALGQKGGDSEASQKKYMKLLIACLVLLDGGDGLGVKLHDVLSRYRRSIDTTIVGGSGQTWGTDEWTPQRIIQHYGPATWNPNERISGA